MFSMALLKHRASFFLANINCVKHLPEQYFAMQNCYLQRSLRETDN